MALLNHRALKDSQTCSFIRELSFKIPDQKVLNQYFLQIKQLSKQIRQRELLEDQKREIKVQDKLQLNKSGRVPRLLSVFPRPNITGKAVGTLEAHRNGLLFMGAKKMRQPIGKLFFKNSQKFTIIS